MGEFSKADANQDEKIDRIESEIFVTTKKSFLDEDIDFAIPQVRIYSIEIHNHLWRLQ